MIRRLKDLLDLDETISLGVLANGWALVAGPISFALIGSYLTPEVQGYYYTFGSVLQFQGFFEIGADQLILQFSSHEWSRLKFENRILSGDPKALSRMATLVRFLLTWYGIAAAATLCVIGPVGQRFFSTSVHTRELVAWRLPWYALCAAFGVQMIVNAFNNLLNGCGQIRQTSAFGLFNVIVTTLVSWAVIYEGGQLWTSPLRMWVGVACYLLFLLYYYRPFIALAWRPSTGHAISWTREMLPFQSKIVLTALAGYFTANLFAPIILRYHGPVIAGKMGMSFALIVQTSVVASLWYQTKVPFFGALIAKKDFEALDRLAFRAAGYFFALSALGYAGLLAGVWILNVIHHPWSYRLLAPHTFLIFEAGMFANTFGMPFNQYLRAHKKEPFMVMNVVYALLLVPSVYWLGRYHGADGAGLAFLGVNLLIAPWVVSLWRRCRWEWHDPARDAATWREIHV